jgi:hypothetical protein
LADWIIIRVISKEGFNMYKFKLFVSLSAFCLSMSSSFAQERKIEENLVFSDPTVVKQKDGWSGGIFLDMISSTVGTSVYDTSGRSSDATATTTKPGFSGYVGKGDLSVLFSYHPFSGNIKTTSDTINVSGAVYEVNLRYLDRANSSWYVPYYLAGFAYIKNDWLVSTVVINGVTELNNTSGLIPEIGAGVIIPRTDKYGYRVDGRIAIGKVRARSNLFSQWTKDEMGGFIRPTATAYYNLSENINLQGGVQYDSLLRGSGVFLQLGTKF